MVYYPSATLYGRVIGICKSLNFPRKNDAYGLHPMRIDLMSPKTHGTFSVVTPIYENIRVGEYLKLNGTCMAHNLGLIFYYQNNAQSNVTISGVSSEKANSVLSCINLNGELTRIYGNESKIHLNFRYFAGEEFDSDTRRWDNFEDTITFVTDNDSLIDRLNGFDHYSFYGYFLNNGNAFLLKDVI